MCLECHTRHEISAEELAKYRSHPVCTDCHGSHRLDNSAG
jgi:predicted CXXCH cytochrome family protein